MRQASKDASKYEDALRLKERELDASLEANEELNQTNTAIKADIKMLEALLK